MTPDLSDLAILAFFTRARANSAAWAAGRRTPQPFEVARAVGVKTFQIHALFDGRNPGTRARAKLLAFNDLTEADLADRPIFYLPEADDARRQVRDKVRAYLPNLGGANE